MRARGGDVEGVGEADGEVEGEGPSMGLTGTGGDVLPVGLTERELRGVVPPGAGPAVEALRQAARATEKASAVVMTMCRRTAPC
jgi:hypothetical protein